MVLSTTTVSVRATKQRDGAAQNIFDQIILSKNIHTGSSLHRTESHQLAVVDDRDY